VLIDLGLRLGLGLVLTYCTIECAIDNAVLRGCKTGLSWDGLLEGCGSGGGEET